nr:gtp-binding protein ypt4 [Quercus suber]
MAPRQRAPSSASGLSTEHEPSAPAGQEMASMYDYLAKIILLGPSGCGKSCLLHRFVKGEWRALSSQTIGVEFASKIVKIGSGARRKRVKLQLWDTAGTERFRSVSRSYYRGAAGALLVYDLASLQSFAALQTFLSDARALASPHLTTLLVGNKADLADEEDGGAGRSGLGLVGPAGESSSPGIATLQRATEAPGGREVSRSMAASWAGQQQITASVEVSALSGDGVEEIFHKLARTILTKIELGEIDPADPMSGIQYGDADYYRYEDGASIKSGSDGFTSTRRRRRKIGWGEVFRVGSGRGFHVFLLFVGSFLQRKRGVYRVTYTDTGIEGHCIRLKELQYIPYSNNTPKPGRYFRGTVAFFHRAAGAPGSLARRTSRSCGLKREVGRELSRRRTGDAVSRPNLHLVTSLRGIREIDVGTVECWLIRSIYKHNACADEEEDGGLTASLGFWSVILATLSAREGSGRMETRSLKRDSSMYLPSCAEPPSIGQDGKGMDMVQQAFTNAYRRLGHTHWVFSFIQEQQFPRSLGRSETEASEALLMMVRSYSLSSSIGHHEVRGSAVHGGWYTWSRTERQAAVRTCSAIDRSRSTGSSRWFSGVGTVRK